MSYKYVVVWHQKARTWISGEPRPIVQHCKCFRSLDKAREFAKEFTPIPSIYIEMAWKK